MKPCTQKSISGYSIMWLYVMFDLPVETKMQRRNASRFRTNLLKDGFTMFQNSIYIRYCMSDESSAVHVKRVESMVPAEGVVSILKITDKQFGRILNFVGKKPREPENKPVQLEFF